MKPQGGEVARLEAVCRRVAEALGVEFPPVAVSARQLAERPALHVLCDAARVRYRKVLLQEDWWRHDHGPLVGYLRTSGSRRRPVALLPGRTGGYRCVEGEGDEGRPVDAALARTLAPEATMLYPPFPGQSLGARDLLGRVFRQGRRDLSLLLGISLAAGGLALLVPWMTKVLVGTVLPRGDVELLGTLALALVVGAVAAAVFQLVRSLTILRFGNRIDLSLQAALWDRVLAMPVSFFRRFTVADLEARVSGLSRIRESLTGEALGVLLGVLSSLASFAVLFYFSWRLALLSVVLFLLLGAVVLVTSRRQVRLQLELQRQRSSVSGLVLELIGAVPKLRMAGAELRGFSRWAERYLAMRRTTVAIQRWTNVQAVAEASWAFLGTLSLFAVVSLWLDGSVPLADFLAFHAAFGQFLAAVLSLLATLPRILALYPLWRRLTPVLEAATEDVGKLPMEEEMRGEVALDGVTFRYFDDGPTVLEDVHLVARPGEMVALVGPSGSGKSTCLRLLLGFERPESGRVLLDGQDLQRLDLGEVRRQVGVVLQNGQPLVGDIFSNVVGSRSYTVDDAWQVLRAVGLEEEVRAMPMGLHTFINQRGTTFSGGQRQRLLIARALLGNPRLVLLDEATTALDNRTQAIVMGSLERLDVTRVVVAHRLSTVHRADRIYVLKEGRVVEVGTYDDLIANGDHFAALAERQLVQTAHFGGQIG